MFDEVAVPKQDFADDRFTRAALVFSNIFYGINPNRVSALSEDSDATRMGVQYSLAALLFSKLLENSADRPLPVRPENNFPLRGQEFGRQLLR